MKTFVSWEIPIFEAKKQLLTTTSNNVELQHLNQDLDRASEIWRAWALRAGGEVIYLSPHIGTITVDVSNLGDIKSIAEEYQQAIKMPVAVGVGLKLQESTQALKIASKNGEGVVFWAPGLEEESKSDSESDILEDLDKAIHHNAPVEQAAPKPEASKSHSQGEGLLNMLQTEASEQPPAPEQTHAAKDAQHAGLSLEDAFHAAAQDHRDKTEADAKAKEEQEKKANKTNGLKQQIAQILQQIKAKGPQLEQLLQQDPESYQAIVGLTQGVIALARQLKEEELSKAEPFKTKPAKGMRTIKLYRATKEDKPYFGHRSNWAEEHASAHAYTDNPGFGGSKLYHAEVTYDPKRVLDIRENRPGNKEHPFLTLAQAIHGPLSDSNREKIEDQLDDWGARGSGYSYPYEIWENSKNVRDKLAQKYDWVRFTDDFPAHSTTWAYLGHTPIAAVPHEDDLDKNLSEVGDLMKTDDEDDLERQNRLTNIEEENRLPNLYNGETWKAGDFHQHVPYRGEPEVTIYRGVPEHVNDFRPGDWVALTPKYAGYHNVDKETGKGKVISMKVPAHHVAWAGTDQNEYFYVPTPIKKDEISATEPDPTKPVPKGFKLSKQNLQVKTSAPTGHEHLNLPVGTVLDGATKDGKTRRKFRVQHSDGTVSDKQGESGVILAEDPSMHPTSAREPHAR